MYKQCLSLFCRLLVFLIIRSGEYVSSAFFDEARRVASRSSLANDKILKATENCYSAVRTKRSLSAEDDPSCIETESMQVMCSGKVNPSDGSRAFCLGRALSTTPRKSCPLSAPPPSFPRRVFVQAPAFFKSTFHVFYKLELILTSITC